MNKIATVKRWQKIAKFMTNQIINWISQQIKKQVASRATSAGLKASQMEGNFGYGIGGFYVKVKYSDKNGNKVTADTVKNYYGEGNHLIRFHINSPENYIDIDLEKIKNECLSNSLHQIQHCAQYNNKHNDNYNFGSDNTVIQNYSNSPNFNNLYNLNQKYLNLIHQIDAKATQIYHYLKINNQMPNLGIGGNVWEIAKSISLAQFDKGIEGAIKYLRSQINDTNAQKTQIKIKELQHNLQKAIIMSEQYASKVIDKIKAKKLNGFSSKLSNNWYSRVKIASDIQSFEDRNILNETVRYMNQCVKELTYLQQYVVQNAPDTKKRIESMIENKKLSSYPKIIQSLKLASSKSLDNYKVCAQLCRISKQLFKQQIKRLQKQRKEFSSITMSKKLQNLKGK